MKRPPITVELYDLTGSWRRWTIGFRPMKPLKNGDTRHGECQYHDRAIWINSRLRNQETIKQALRHEVGHATLGPNFGELPISILDDNTDLVVKKVFPDAK